MQPEPKPQLYQIQACADPTRKSYGEASEAAFLARACSLGFSVAKPWGDSARYDFLVDADGKLWRVQVKSTQRYAEKRYRVKNAGSRASAYTAEEIDFVAAHIVPLDLWYIVPIQASGSSRNLRFYPHGTSNSLFEKYREAWCLLSCTPKARGWKDIPIACRNRNLKQKCNICPCGTDTPVRRR
jgi:hypothetical protein